MFTISKGQRYRKQILLIAEYAQIIADYTKLPKGSDEVQDAATTVYIKEHGKLVRMGP